MKQKYKECWDCKGTGRKKIIEHNSTKDVKRMLRILKRNGLTQQKVADLLKIGQSTISSWFTSKNLTGKINPLYFEKLKAKGYK